MKSGIEQYRNTALVYYTSPTKGDRMMSLKELTMQNLCAAIREVSNAYMVAQFQPYNKTPSGIPTAVLDHIYEARLLLEMAQQELQDKSLGE